MFYTRESAIGINTSEDGRRAETCERSTEISPYVATDVFSMEIIRHLRIIKFVKGENNYGGKESKRVARNRDII